LSCVSTKPSMPQLACVYAWEAPPWPFAASQCLSALPFASTQVTFQSLQAALSCAAHTALTRCAFGRGSAGGHLQQPDIRRQEGRYLERGCHAVRHPVLRCARGPPQAGLAPLPARVPALPGPWRRLKRGRQGTLRCMSARAEYPFERPGDAGDPQRFQKARATAARRLFPVSHLWWPCSACGP